MHPLRLLVVDESPDAAVLVVDELLRAGYTVDWIRVETPERLVAALDGDTSWDGVLAEYDTPGLGPAEILAHLRQRELDLPFLIVSARPEAEAAGAALKAGAQDYIPKSRLTRLVPALEREIRDAGIRRGRRGVETELRRSEERFQLAARASNDVLWEYVFSGARLWWSDNLPATLGHQASDVPDLDAWAELIHPEDRERVQRGLAAAIAQPISALWSDEYRMRRADGSYAYVLDRGYIEHDPDHRPGRMVGSLVDISDRRANQIALLESEHRYRMLFETMAQGVIYRDRDGAIIAANPAAVRILGVPEAQLVGVSPEPDWRGIYPDGTPLSEADYPDRVALRTGDAASSVIGVHPPDHDDVRWIHVHATPQFRPGDSKPYQVYALFADVTDQRNARLALRRSEAYFRSLIEQSGDLVAILDSTGGIRYASPSYLRVLGHETESLIGSNAFDLVHEADRDSLRASLERVIAFAGTGGLTLVEHRLRHADGSWRIVESSGRNRLADPHLNGVIVNSRDITDRRALEDRLSRSQRMEAVGRLAGGIAHDFNNLLTVMGGAAEHLLEDLAPEYPGRADVEEIRQAVHRARDLTRQLLAFSRKQVFELRTLDVNRVIIGMEPLLRRLIGADIQLEIRADAEHPMVRADESQVQQVILNLVVNARDAMPAGGSVAVETCDGSCDRHAPTEGPAFVEIRVRDSGVGIDPDALDRIFDPFYTTKQDGTGLGLATVYGVVSQSGGEVLCDSVPGEGTTFRVRLPAIAGREESATRTTPLTVDGAGQRVLLVEDDPGVRRFAHRALTNAGYQVTDATDGGDAQRLLAQHDGDFDLLLTDVVMPGTGGLELVDWARRRWPDLPTLFMSGYPHAELAARGMTLEEHEIMPKPFEIAVILQRVHAAIAGANRG